MIPIKLSVRNFMPYRDNVPPLYFAGIHTASIWGDNGNGKSALIDAITWALWGKTRARSDDDLIHLGQTEMEVEFDFAVGEQVYRVIRKHARPKRRRSSGQSSLDLLVASGDGFKVISGEGIRQTEQKIKDTLHMDYDTFINSAFLRQGHADEFTVANPAKRKQVLVDILGLSLYDALEEQSRELARQQETEKALAESAIKDISEELAHKPAYENELKQSQSELFSIETIIREQESRLNELRQKKELLKNRQSQLTQLEEHLTETARTLEHWHDQMKQQRSRIKDYEQLIAQRSNIEQGFTQFIEAKKSAEELNHKLALNSRLNQRKHELDMAIERAQATLVTEHKLADSKIAELDASAQKLPGLRNELQQIQARLNQLADEAETLSQQRQNGQELRTHVNYLESGKARLEQEIAEITEKLSLLLNESGAKCPLCETELGVDGLKLIETKYAAEKQAKSDSINSIQSELAQQRTQLDSLEGKASQLETRLNQERASAQSQTSLLNKEIGESEKDINQLNKEREKLAEIEERLARKDFAIAEQEARRQLENELSELDYDSQQHEEVRHHLTTLEQYETPQRKLEEADRQIGQEREAASRTGQAIAGLQHSQEADTEKIEELITELGALPQLDSDLARAENEHQMLNSQQKQAQEIVGSARGKLERCAELEIRNKEREKRLNQASKEEKIYRDLAQAFGKKGIQALLIEMALPEIETEANKLLGRMTDNRMHVKIETQRETKKGDVLETLDIKVADELGTRNYEMFSGGEAFRINLAIRIALSKLLARRAGAPLPTLIIDEGFGTQDSTALEKLKEAITSIQDDFQKILVITHIEELRDAFPTRIDVIKTAEGSTIEIS